MLTRLLRRPCRLLWFLPLLMAMDGPGCVMSEHPLTRFSARNVDTSILGEWVDPGDPEERTALDIRLRDDGRLEFRSYEGAEYTVLAGHTSSVNGETYASLQFVDAGCDDCTEEELQKVRTDFLDDYAPLLPEDPANECTWMIVRYRHEAGRLAYGLLEEDAIEDAIASGILSGRVGPDEGESVGPCVSSPARRFRRYLRLQEADALAPLSDELFRRRRAPVDPAL